MKKQRRDRALRSLVKRLRRSARERSEGEPAFDYLNGDFDQEDLRDFEESILGDTGLCYLAGNRLRKYEARVKEIEKIFLRTAYIPIDGSEPGVEIAEQARSLPPQGADRLVPLAHWRPETAKNQDGANGAQENGRLKEGTSRKATRSGALGDVRFVPVVTFQPSADGLNRLQTSESRWQCPRAEGALTRRRSLGDLSELAFVRPQDAGRGLNRLETTFSDWSRPHEILQPRQHSGEGLNRLQATFSNWTQPEALVKPQQQGGEGLNRLQPTFSNWTRPEASVKPQDAAEGLNRLENRFSTWARPQMLPRSRSFDDLAMQTVGAQSEDRGLNRLETFVVPWTSPQIERKLSEVGPTPRAVPSVTPQHLREGLNRLETSLWVWSSPTPKKGAKRITRCKKLLRLRHPAPLRFRGSFDGRRSRRSDSSPFWVSSSDFDSEAAQSMSRIFRTPSPHDRGHRHHKPRWALEEIVECSAEELGEHVPEGTGKGGSDAGTVDSCGMSPSVLFRSEDSLERGVLLSARKVYAVSEEGSSGFDKDPITRLVAEAPDSRFIIREKKSQV